MIVEIIESVCIYGYREHIVEQILHQLIWVRCVERDPTVFYPWNNVELDANAAGRRASNNSFARKQHLRQLISGNDGGRTEPVTTEFRFLVIGGVTRHIGGIEQVEIGQRQHSIIYRRAVKSEIMRVILCVGTRNRDPKERDRL